MGWKEQGGDFKSKADNKAVHADVVNEIWRPIIEQYKPVSYDLSPESMPSHLTSKPQFPLLHFD
jgi:hypothetical protein